MDAIKSDVKRDSNGRLLPGHGLISPGRPEGSISLKDKVRQHLNEHPEDVQEIVEHFVKTNRELMWQMLEGRPSQGIGQADDLPPATLLVKIVRDGNNEHPGGV